jgi:biopolymer transport protein ExbB
MRRRQLWTTIMALTLPALAAFGQAASAEPLSLSWRDLWGYGGLLMYVLAGLSALAVAFILYFFTVLRRSQVAPAPLQRALLDAIRRGSPDDARRACEARPCPLSAVGQVALDYLRDIPGADPGLLKDVMEGEGARQAETIQGQPQYLLDIAVVAPMVGLLGTVIGMLRAFSTIALDIGKAKPILLAAGVSQALVTTAFGLVVAIPAMAFYAYFRRQSSKMVSDLESASTDLLTALLSTRSK